MTGNRYRPGDRVRDTASHHGTVRSVQLADHTFVEVEFDADPPGTRTRVERRFLRPATSRSERKARP